MENPVFRDHSTFKIGTMNDKLMDHFMRMKWTTIENLALFKWVLRCLGMNHQIDIELVAKIR